MKRPASPLALDLVVAVLSVLGSLAARWLDLFDGLVTWLQANKGPNEEKLLGAAFILPFGLAIISPRRWRDLRQELHDREAAARHLADAARLEGVLLAARTMQHHLNNKLGVTVGYAELLAEDTSLSPEQREMASLALHGAEQSAVLLDRLRSLTRVDVLHVGAPDGPVLALDDRRPAGASAVRG